ncbi:MAG: SMP-30/gluconolactonase/LRE family protein [Pyrinomonadaceae bacterium]
MSETERIKRISPGAALPGGEVSIECAQFAAHDFKKCGAWFGGTRGRLVGASARRVLAIVPEVDLDGGTVEVRVGNDDLPEGGAARLTVGRKLAEDIHMVASPAVDPEDGSIYVTRSGSRGQRAPVSLFSVSGTGGLTDVTGDITNPTGIAFDPHGQLFVTSRLDGTVYRVTNSQEVVPFARNLGVATGLAFDRAGRMYVGDRTGTIYRVSDIGEGEEWGQSEPSVAAYHLAFGPDEALYISGPTVSSYDAITRIDKFGRRSPFFRGLGRPGGLAFDRDGNLYVAASYKARRGVVRISPDGQRAELYAAGMNVIGLAFNAEGDMIVATNDAVFSLAVGVRGTLLT